MVNLKKIGAIATGALFVGATIGMAAAAVSPDFSKDMLAKGGVAQAQLVVGAAAPGKTADEASAKIIQDKVKAKLGVATGGNVDLKYGSDDLDDSAVGLPHAFRDAVTGDSTAWNKLKLDTNSEGKYYKINNRTAPNATTYGLMFDKDGNGKLNDAADYVLYNYMTVVDSRGDIKFVYEPDQDTTYNVSADSSTRMYGNVYKIKGGKYAFTKNDSATEFELGPAIAKVLSKVSSLDVKNALSLTGDLKAQFVVPAGGGATDGTLYLVKGDSLEASILPTSTYLENMATYENGAIVSGKLKDGMTPDSFKGYKIFVKFSNVTTDVTFTMADKSQLTKLINEQSDVMGYAKFYGDLTGAPDGFSAPARRGLFLVSPTISLVRDDVIDLADTYYQLDFDADKYLDIKRKKTVSVPSGTKLKKTHSEYSKFLSQTVTVSAAGGAPGVGPTLEIKDEAGANKAMNLVLMGGPVANKLTAELVTGKKSKTDWLASAGDVEVVKDAFTSGKNAIIVAGKDRAATKAAAEALAALL